MSEAIAYARRLRNLAIISGTTLLRRPTPKTLCSGIVLVTTPRVPTTTMATKAGCSREPVPRTELTMAGAA